MLKKITAIAITFTMILSITSCSKTKDANGEGLISPASKEGKPELIILMHEAVYADLAKTKYIKEYIDKFEKNFGVDIKLEKISSDDGSMSTPEEQKEYMKKLSTKLYPKNGPELIFTHNMSVDALISQGAVVDLRGKVPNLDKVYNSLLGDKAYYAPLGICYMSKILNKDALAELGIAEPGLDWTSRDYLAIRDKWVSKAKPLFNQVDYEFAFNQFIDLLSLYNPEENKLVLNTTEVRQKIRNIRDYNFDGKFQLPNGYKYENYYNMCFEEESEEFKLGWQYYEINQNNGSIYKGIITNLFNAKHVDETNAENGTIMYPEFKDREVYIDSYGFLVNKNGKNLNLAYEFINGLLTDEIQMGMFKDKEFLSGENSLMGYYPANKEIEADILKQEAEYKLDPKVTELKAYALQELKDGRFKLGVITNDRFYIIFHMIYKDFGKFILADEPYSDEQLQAELKKMEDKYNIYLNE